MHASNANVHFATTIHHDSRRMKPVHQRLAEFGEELSEVEAVPAYHRNQAGCKRYPQRLPAHKPGHRGPEFLNLASPSSINLTCTRGVKDQTEEEQKTPKVSTAQASLQVNPEWRQLQLRNIWGQKQTKLTSQLSHFTLVGQGPQGVQEQPTIVMVKDVGSDIPTDGNTEWTAVTLQLPSHDSTAQLAYILFCKGVSKAELPRVSIGDWKPGSIGVPTFHCQRCLTRWIRKGNLPAECNKPEDITEGPAMGITFTDQASSEMIVDGIMGEDGKPIRIRVKSPESIQKLLKRRERRKKEKSKKDKGHTEGRSINRNDSANHNDQTASDASDGEDFSSSGCSDVELLDLPEPFKKYILKRNHKHKKHIHYEGARSSANGSIGISGSSSGKSPTSESVDSADESVQHPSCPCDHHHHHHNYQHAKHSRKRRTKAKSNHGSGKARHQRKSEEGSYSSWSESESHLSANGLQKRSRRKQKSDDPHLPLIPGATLGEAKKSCHSKVHGAPDHLPEIVGKDSANLTSLKCRDGPYSEESRCGSMSERRRLLLAHGSMSGNHFQLPDNDENPGQAHFHSKSKSQGHSMKYSQHLPHLNPANTNMVQQGSQDQANWSDYEAQARSGKSGGTSSAHVNSSTVARKGSKILSSLSSQPEHKASVLSLNHQNSTSESPTHSQQGNQRFPDDISGRTATVKQDVHLPVKQPDKGSIQKARKRQKTQKHFAKNKAQIQGPIHPPKQADKVMKGAQLDPKVNLQHLKSGSKIDEEKYELRYGRRAMRKTRRPTITTEAQASINHNSKDLGNLVGHMGSDENIGSRVVREGSANPYRRQHLKPTSSNEQLPSSGRLTGSGDLKQSLHYIPNDQQSSMAALLHAKRSFTAAMSRANTGESSSFMNHTDPQLLSSGLGTRFPNSNRRASVAPVHLKPLGKMANKDVILDIGLGGVNKNPSLTPIKSGTWKKAEETEAEANHTFEATIGQKTDTDSGLEVVTEEESSEEDEIAPLYELKPITGLSFTSPFSFSIFPVAIQYKNTYERVREKAVEPVRYAKGRLARKR